MIRVVLDTNVLVSGFLWTGSVTRVVEAWIKGKFDAVVSAETFEELRRILEDLGKGRRARYIVTGDKALLAVQAFHGVETIKPAIFLNRI